MKDFFSKWHSFPKCTFFTKIETDDDCLLPAEKGRKLSISDCWDYVGGTKVITVGCSCSDCLLLPSAFWLENLLFWVSVSGKAWVQNESSVFTECTTSTFDDSPFVFVIQVKEPWILDDFQSLHFSIQMELDQRHPSQQWIQEPSFTTHISPSTSRTTCFARKFPKLVAGINANSFSRNFSLL